MRYRNSLALVATGMAVSLLGPAAVQAQTPTPVVTSFSILGDMTERIGGSQVDVTTLVGPGGDAHVYQPTPQAARAVSGAELFIVNGLQFEGWLDRLVDASDFSGQRVVVTDGVEPIAFGDAAEEMDSHGDEHAQGGHAFEWGGLFDLEAGTYEWSFAKVGGDYADPAMKMVIQAADDLEAAEETAEDLMEADSSEARVPGETLSADDAAYALNFDADQNTSVFTVEIEEAGTYAFFTEHMPFEFEANEHFFKDMAGADVEPVSQEPEGDHGHHDHDHGASDPHTWQSVPNAITYVENITEALAAADPAHADLFEQRAERYISELEALDERIRATIEALPAENRTVVTSHDAFQYFADEYGVTFFSPQGVSTETEASAKDVAELIETMRDRNVSAVFFENITDTRLLERIADETGSSVGGTLYPGALSEPNGPAPTYIEMMEHNADTLEQALGGDHEESHS